MLVTFKQRVSRLGTTPAHMVTTVRTDNVGEETFARVVCFVKLDRPTSSDTVAHLTMTPEEALRFAGELVAKATDAAKLRTVVEV